jgi:hypothetical protein
MFGLDLLELQYVGDADDGGQPEARVGAEQRRHVRPEERVFEHGGLRFDTRAVDRRHGLQGNDDRHHEDAEPAFLRRDLRVEIRDGQQPDKRGDGLRRPGKRHVSGGHGLHADDKGVRERAGDEQRGGRPAGRRRTAAEVDRVGDERARINGER